MSRTLSDEEQRYPQVEKEALARTEVWWPNMDTEIEEMIKNCTTCCKFANKPNINDNELVKWKRPTKPF